jgi:hypothetical protein
MGEHGDNIALDGESREAVCDDDSELTEGWVKQVDGTRMQGATEIWLAEIGVTIRGIASQLKNCN